jgi:hypothetical protein
VRGRRRGPAPACLRPAGLGSIICPCGFLSPPGRFPPIVCTAAPFPFLGQTPFSFQFSFTPCRRTDAPSYDFPCHRWTARRVASGLVRTGPPLLQDEASDWAASESNALQFSISIPYVGRAACIILLHLQKKGRAYHMRVTKPCRRQISYGQRCTAETDAMCSGLRRIGKRCRSLLPFRFRLFLFQGKDSPAL